MIFQINKDTKTIKVNYDFVGKFKPAIASRLYEMKNVEDIEVEVVRRRWYHKLITSLKKKFPPRTSSPDKETLATLYFVGHITVDQKGKYHLSSTKEPSFIQISNSWGKQDRKLDGIRDNYDAEFDFSQQIDEGNSSSDQRIPRQVEAIESKYLGGEVGENDDFYLYFEDRSYPHKTRYAKITTDDILLMLKHQGVIKTEYTVSREGKKES